MIPLVATCFFLPTFIANLRVSVLPFQLFVSIKNSGPMFWVGGNKDVEFIVFHCTILALNQ